MMTTQEDTDPSPGQGHMDIFRKQFVVTYAIMLFLISELQGRYISFCNFNGSIVNLKTGRQWATLKERVQDTSPPVTNLLAYKQARGIHVLKHMMEMTKRKEESVSSLSDNIPAVT